MVPGIALMALGALGASALFVFVLSASSEGALDLAALGTVNPRVGAAAAAVVAVAATTLFLLGLDWARRVRRRRAEVGRLDRRAIEAEEEARATLLAMRLGVLQREVSELERRNEDEPVGSRVSARPSVFASNGVTPSSDVVVIPED